MADKKADTKLLSALRAGASIEAACKAANIDPDKLKKRLTEDKELGCRFAKAVTEAEITYLETLQQAAADGDWRAAAWWLERRGHGFAKDKQEEKDKEPAKRELIITIKKVEQQTPQKTRKKSQ